MGNIIADISGAMGYQPSGATAAMINKHSSALALGDVVTNSYAHTGFVYPATTAAEELLTPLACVVLADGNLVNSAGMVGVVTGLMDNAGAVGTAVQVQFGGICQAKVVPTIAVVFGMPLAWSDTAGTFGNDAGTTATGTAAIAYQAITATSASASLINVLLSSNIYSGTVV